MPQNTNLNVSPYFDDFDADKKLSKGIIQTSNSFTGKRINDFTVYSAKSN